MKLLGAVLALVLAGCSPSDMAPRLVGTTVVLQLDSGRVFCSGVAVSETEILTGEHCRSLGPTYVRTEFGEPMLAEVVWAIESKDLMLLHVPGAKFTPAKIGDSGLVRTGDLVYQVGAPYGDLEFSFAVGYVGHTLRMPPEIPNAVFFQIYSESRGGNSGGPLFNARGQLIGIVVRSDMAGLTFVVPVNLAGLLPDTEVLNAYP